MDWGNNKYQLLNNSITTSTRLQPIGIHDNEMPHSHDHTFAGTMLPNQIIQGMTYNNNNNCGYVTTPKSDISQSNFLRDGFDNKLESLDAMAANRSPSSKVELLLQQLALDAVALLKSEREDRELIKENMARAAFDAYKSFEDDLKNKALDAVKEMQIEMSKERAIYTGENEELIEKCKRMEREFNRIRNINLNDCGLLKQLDQHDKNKLIDMTVDLFDKFKDDLTRSVIDFIGENTNDNDVDEFIHTAILSQATL